MNYTWKYTKNKDVYTIVWYDEAGIEVCKGSVKVIGKEDGITAALVGEAVNIRERNADLFITEEEIENVES